jgi:hypothetical protein
MKMPYVRKMDTERSNDAGIESNNTPTPMPASVPPTVTKFDFHCKKIRLLHWYIMDGQQRSHLETQILTYNLTGICKSNTSTKHERSAFAEGLTSDGECRSLTNSW